MRPKKRTVEYFPHRTNSGRTIFILESLYGNDGYAAWFKILELLGSSPDHFFDFNGAANFQYLSAKIGVPGDKTIMILKTLAEVDAIDQDLHSQGIIWSENFASGLDAVYNKRGTGCPGKPSLRNGNTAKGVVSGTETTVSGTETPRRKGKEREVKGREGKGINNTCPEASKTPSEPVAEIEPILQIPLNLKDSFFDVTENDVDQWQEAFPGIDVLSELRKCQQWNVSYPKRRKTKAGIRGHISAWLGRAQDSAKPSPVDQGRNGNLRPYSVKDAATIQHEDIARALNDEHRKQQQHLEPGHCQEGGVLLEHPIPGSRVCQ